MSKSEADMGGSSFAADGKVANWGVEAGADLAVTRFCVIAADGKAAARFCVLGADGKVVELGVVAETTVGATCARALAA